MDGPIPHQRQAGRGQPEPERGNLSPREASSTKLQAGFVANQDFLGFWMVDLCQEGCSQRSAPQKRHTAHRAAGTREAIRCTPNWGETVLAKHLVS